MGQHVRIISGPFCDFDAIFEGYLSGSKRVAILITTVEGSGVRVVADAASITT
jgi:transcription antitermination factor NusG